MAILLSLNAGFINGCAYMAFKVLTTNITGHAALLAVDLTTGNFLSAVTVALWVSLFLGGAFTCGLLISKVGADKPFSYTLPIGVIIFFVLAVALSGHEHNSTLAKKYFAGSLLFAMGMQNAVVSLISGSIVRTTHLTGIVTDLGIDLSKALLSKDKLSKNQKNKISLRLVIILCFLIGGIIGCTLFIGYQFNAFYLPILILLAVIFYDYFRAQVIKTVHERKFK